MTRELIRGIFSVWKEETIFIIRSGETKRTIRKRGKKIRMQTNRLKSGNREKSYRSVQKTQ